MKNVLLTKYQTIMVMSVLFISTFMNQGLSLSQTDISVKQDGLLSSIGNVIGNVVNTVKNIISQPPKQAPTPSVIITVQPKAQTYNVATGTTYTATPSGATATNSKGETTNLVSTGSSGGTTSYTVPNSYYNNNNGYVAPTCSNTCTTNSCSFYNWVGSQTIGCQTSSCSSSTVKCSLLSYISCTGQFKKTLVDENTQEIFCGNCLTFKDCPLQGGYPVMYCDRATKEGQCKYGTDVQGTINILQLQFLGKK